MPVHGHHDRHVHAAARGSEACVKTPHLRTRCRLGNPMLPGLQALWLLLCVWSGAFKTAAVTHQRRARHWLSPETQRTQVPQQARDFPHLSFIETPKH